MAATPIDRGAAPAMPPEPVWCITGPTAAGKSAICTAVATELPVEFINVDSATIYRGMDIGTAKPDLAERERLHHHLLDILDPADSYSVAAFYDDAIRLVQEIRARGRHPILVGGTMMYYHALARGLAELPSADASVRAHIDAEAATHGWPAMHARLAQVDPETAARLAPADRQRIGRALEVHAVSGIPMSTWLAKETQTRPAVPLRVISLEPSDRLALHARITERFDAMLEQGLLDEVGQLYARGDLHPDLPSIRCVGYRQMWPVVAQGAALAEAREKALAATRQLAKRQLTWLRGMPERQQFDCLDDPARTQAAVLRTLMPALSA